MPRFVFDSLTKWILDFYHSVRTHHSMSTEKFFDSPPPYIWIMWTMHGHTHTNTHTYTTTSCQRTTHENRTVRMTRNNHPKVRARVCVYAASNFDLMRKWQDAQRCARIKLVVKKHANQVPSMDILNQKLNVTSNCMRGEYVTIWWVRQSPEYVCACERQRERASARVTAKVENSIVSSLSGLSGLSFARCTRTAWQVWGFASVGGAFRYSEQARHNDKRRLKVHVIRILQIKNTTTRTTERWCVFGRSFWPYASTKSWWLSDGAVCPLAQCESTKQHKKMEKPERECTNTDWPLPSIVRKCVFTSVCQLLNTQRGSPYTHHAPCTCTFNAKRTDTIISPIGLHKSTILILNSIFSLVSFHLSGNRCCRLCLRANLIKWKLPTICCYCDDTCSYLSCTISPHVPSRSCHGARYDWWWMDAKQKPIISQTRKPGLFIRSPTHSHCTDPANYFYTTTNWWQKHNQQIAF